MSSFVPWQAQGKVLDLHPCKIAEPINLASANSPTITYEMKSSPKNISTMQKETIQLIMQSFIKRNAFLLGDATGVGKGRVIAGLISEVFASNNSVNVLWLSVNSRLKQDAINELSKVGLENAIDSFVVFGTYKSINNLRLLREYIYFLQNSGTLNLLILDECHYIRNPNGKTSMNITYLLDQINTNILYSSATAISQPNHLQYLKHLGIYGSGETCFRTFDELSNALKIHGSDLMEMISIDMKSRGAYVARQLSFENVIIEEYKVVLTKYQEAIYDLCVTSLQTIHGKTHQHFFHRLITAFKVDEVIKLTEKELNAGNSVIISLMYTSEAASQRFIRSNNYNSFVGEEISELSEILHNLPQNALDQLIFHFGDRIAELTGRSKRIVRRNGNLELETNLSLVKQIEEFKDGKKDIAVLSRAGGVGLNLNDSKNKGRTHILLELPWSVEDLLQQMGRSYRTSNINPPKYILVTTNIPSEMRFLSAIVTKLKSFGALVKADRNTCLPFLKAPKWNASARRKLELFLAVANAAMENENLTPMRYHTALFASNCTPYDNELKVRTTLISNLRQHNIGYRRQNTVSAAYTLFPHELTMLFSKWHVSKHKWFPEVFRQRVIALLMCANAFETQNTLGILPKDLLFEIIQHMCDINLENTKKIARSFRFHDLQDLAKINTDVILNKMLGMRLSIQQHIFDIMENISEPEKSQNVSCLLKYASDRVGNVNANVVNVEATQIQGIDGIIVTLEYKKKEVSEPEFGCVFWCDKNKRICWTNANKIVFSDGRIVNIQCTAEIMLNKGFVLSSRHDWDEAVLRINTNTQKRCNRAQTQFKLVTKNAFSVWESSHKRIFRIPKNKYLPFGSIGILMNL